MKILRTVRKAESGKRKAETIARSAGLETRDTADLEVCATTRFRKAFNSKFKIQNSKLYLRQPPSLITHHSSLGFTLMEIAICLAVVGVALVAIIGVLPIGLNVQQANREETVVGQDSTVFMNAIRNGALGLDDLTNYVYAITNYWGEYNAAGQETASGAIGYAYGILPAGESGSAYPNNSISLQPITNGANIIGLMSTPEFMGVGSDDYAVGAGAGQPIPSLMFGGISNHIVAYAYSMSGPAVQKPPQNNSIVLQDSFGYRIYCVNAPMAVNTNLFFASGDIWNPGDSYRKTPITVFWNWMYWTCTNANGAASGDVPGATSATNVWQMVPNYSLEMALNMRDLRLTFFWPQLPNGNLGPNQHTFRTVVAGQLLHQPGPVANFTPVYNTNAYVYQSESFTNVP